MFVNEKIPVKKLNPNKDDSETFFIETNLRLRKWLRVKAYKSLQQIKSVFLEHLKSIPNI